MVIYFWLAFPLPSKRANQYNPTGIGNMGGEWDPFLKDKECPFFPKAKSGSSAARKQRESWLLKFVEDR